MIKKLVYLFLLLSCVDANASKKDIFLASSAYGFSYQLGTPIFNSSFIKNHPTSIRQLGYTNAFQFHFIRNRPLRQWDYQLSYWQNVNRARFDKMTIATINNTVQKGKQIERTDGFNFIVSHTILDKVVTPKLVINFGAGIDYVARKINKLELTNPLADTSTNRYTFENNDLSRLGFVAKFEIGKEFEITRTVAMRFTFFYQHQIHKKIDNSAQNNFGTFGLKCFTYFVE